ncbi:MAG: phosphatidate cytidylyltransferase [bacterium]
MEGLFANPLANPIFIPLMTRMLVLFSAGFLILLALKKGNYAALMGSNLGQRYVGWLILFPIYVVGTFFGALFGHIVLFAFMYLALAEIVRVSGLSRAYHVALVVLSIYSLFIAALHPEYFFSLPLVYFIVLTLVAIRSNDAEKGLQQAAVSLFVAIWIIFSMSHIDLLAHLNNHLDQTSSLVFLVIFAVALADIGGYIFGKTFEKLHFFDAYKIAPNLSPNKTYAGTLGYMIGAGIGIAFLYFAVGGYLAPPLWVVVAVLIGLFAPVGGMTHSLFKRFYGVKDSGSLIPGHGGILDRVDSMVRVVVILYYFFRLFL